MDDASSLEEEFEQDLLLEPPEPPLASTPRQRLEDARAMADGNCDVTLGGDGGFPVPGIDDGDGEEPDTSTHLLQRLSCVMADGGEWKCFHDITHASQCALAEMNETLGSLRQWQKHRKINSSSSAPTRLEDAPTTTAVGEKLLQRENPRVLLDCCSSEPMTTLTRDRQKSGGDDADACEQENLHSVRDEGILGGEQEDPLLVLWQEHHLRAQQAVGRLQEQLDRHSQGSSFTTRGGTSNNESTENHGFDGATTETADDEERGIRSLLAQEGAAESSSGSGGDISNIDRVAELSRNVNGLQIHQWIQTTRTQACDRAETLAREACEDMKRGAGSAAVGEMEGELDGFAQELDSLLSRIDRVDNNHDTEEEGPEGDDVLLLEAPRIRSPQGGLAPAADAHVDRAE